MAIVTQAVLPDRLPHEPASVDPTGPRRLGWLALRAGGLCLIFSLITVPTVPMYLVVRLFVRRPPVVTPPGLVWRTLRRILLQPAPQPGMSALSRIAHLLNLLWDLGLGPALGLAWYLDEALYGRELDAMRVQAPIIELSAARSGSTQLARHLEDDPGIVSPSLLMALMPYLWVWELARTLLGGVINRDTVRAFLRARWGETFLERHELDPFRTDTLEVPFMFWHLGQPNLAFGADGALSELGLHGTDGRAEALWGEFTTWFLRLGAKTLVFDGLRGGPPRRLLMKGHFLGAAPAIARAWPDARFLTMLRDPAKRLQSHINYMRVNPHDPLAGPPSWAAVVGYCVGAELAYCDEEMRWFGAPDGPRRCIVRFQDYVRDLDGTLGRVYRELLDREPPGEPAPSHPERRRTGYSVDRSLEALGVDEAALKDRLAAWQAWCDEATRPEVREPRTRTG